MKLLGVISFTSSSGQDANLRIVWRADILDTVASRSASGIPTRRVCMLLRCRQKDSRLGLSQESQPIYI